MAKVTSKLQVTIPKRIADDMGIAPGDEIQFVPSGQGLRVVLGGRPAAQLSVPERLALFDLATRRQQARQRGSAAVRRPSDRGWKRDQLYDRGRAG